MQKRCYQELKHGSKISIANETAWHGRIGKQALLDFLFVRGVTVDYTVADITCEIISLINRHSWPVFALRWIAIRIDSLTASDEFTPVEIRSTNEEPVEFMKNRFANLISRCSSHPIEDKTRKEILKFFHEALRHLRDLKHFDSVFQSKVHHENNHEYNVCVCHLSRK